MTPISETAHESPALVLQIPTRSWHGLAELPVLLNRATRVTLRTLALRGHGAATRARVTVRLSDNAEVCALNTAWRNVARPTNVLSFPAADPETLRQDARTLPAEARCDVGDLILSWQYIHRERGGNLLAIRTHAVHLVIHGILHIFGYTHDLKRSERIMRACESRIMRRLGLRDPWRVSVHACRNDKL